MRHRTFIISSSVAVSGFSIDLAPDFFFMPPIITNFLVYATSVTSRQVVSVPFGPHQRAIRHTFAAAGADVRVAPRRAQGRRSRLLCCSGPPQQPCNEEIVTEDS